MLNTINKTKLKSEIQMESGKSKSIQRSPDIVGRYFSIIILSLILLFSEKTNAQAPNWLWAKSMGGRYDDYGTSIAIDVSGNVYTTGSFSGTVDFDPGAGVFNLTGGGIFISKFDGSSNFVWAKALGGTFENVGSSITFDASGNGYVAGYFQSPSITFGSTTLTNADNTGNSYDIFIAKLDNVINGIESVKINNGFSVYPNPVKELLVIRYPLLGYKKVTITITDITGKIIYTSTTSGTENMEMNTTNFSDGMYLVQIKSEDFIETKKIIVVK